MFSPRGFIVGLILGMLLFMPFAINGSYFKPVPYGHVELVTLDETDLGYYLEANFIKTDCTFNRLEVVGTSLGTFTEIPWSNVKPRDISKGEKFDRTEGAQTLRINILTEGKTYDSLEVRTRHLCGETKVDKTFIKVEL